MAVLNNMGNKSFYRTIILVWILSLAAVWVIKTFTPFLSGASSSGVVVMSYPVYYSAQWLYHALKSARGEGNAVKIRLVLSQIAYSTSLYFGTVALVGAKDWRLELSVAFVVSLIMTIIATSFALRKSAASAN